MGQGSGSQRGAQIAELIIERFRGVPDEFRLPMLVNGKSASLLVVGDNGSGKSTILDAIEFCLQGTIRNSGFSTPHAPRLRNVFADLDKISKCNVVLADGTAVSRTTTPGRRHGKDVPPTDGFRLPFVFRRNDMRELLATNNHGESPLLRNFSILLKRFLGGTPAAEAAYGRRQALQREKLELETRLISLAGVDPAHFPRRLNNLEAWARQRRGGRPGMTKEEKRRLSSLPEPETLIVDRLREIYAELSRNRKITYAEGKHRVEPLLQEQLTLVSEQVTEAFSVLQPGNSVVSRLVFETDSSWRNEFPRIIPKLELLNGLVTMPAKVLSEAGLDLLAILIHLHFVRAAAEYGQARVLVLDDVFTAADAVLRARLATYIFDTLPSWQLVISFHDKLWHEQFRRAALAAKHPFRSVECGPWTPQAGLRVYDAPNSPSTPLELLLRANPPDQISIASRAGLLLEALCDHLTVSLELPMPRRLSQQYSLGELWPPVHKFLERTTARAAADGMNRSAHLRNLYGAHYTVWAQNVSLQEVLDFADDVLTLWRLTYCGTCDQFIRRARGTLGCPCGATSL